VTGAALLLAGIAAAKRGIAPGIGALLTPHTLYSRLTRGIPLRLLAVLCSFFIL